MVISLDFVTLNLYLFKEGISMRSLYFINFMFEALDTIIVFR